MKAEQKISSRAIGRTSGPKYCPTSLQDKTSTPMGQRVNQNNTVKLDDSSEEDVTEHSHEDVTEYSLETEASPSSGLLQTTEMQHQSSAVSTDSSSENESEEVVKAPSSKAQTHSCRRTGKPNCPYPLPANIKMAV